MAKVASLIKAYESLSAPAIYSAAALASNVADRDVPLDYVLALPVASTRSDIIGGMIAFAPPYYTFLVLQHGDPEPVGSSFDASEGDAITCTLSQEGHLLFKILDHSDGGRINHLVANLGARHGSDLARWISDSY